MEQYAPSLEYLREQHQHMMQLVFNWSAINSGSFHLEGLARMAKALEDNFHWLGGQMEMLDLASLERVNRAGVVERVTLGKALRIRKRPEAPLQVFLCGHMDTVFSEHHPFQDPRFSEDYSVLTGPGVTDLKGGLVVMLKALEALERTPFKDNLGWEVLINPDEEIGSPGSAPLLKEAAARHHLGLIFEPCLPDGALVSKRKGSGNFTLVVHGKAAHAGRDYGDGRNAIVAISDAALRLDALTAARPGLIVNCGLVEGGSAVNTVADLAILRFNVRVDQAEDTHFAERKIAEIISIVTQQDGFSAELHGGFGRLPKPVSEDMKRLQTAIEECGTMLGIPVQWKASGGVCDGNNLAEYGLPNVDTLGVRGGNIHSDQEYLVTESLLERSQLAALLLMRLASGDLRWERL